MTAARKPKVPLTPATIAATLQRQTVDHGAEQRAIVGALLLVAQRLDAVASQLQATELVASKVLAVLLKSQPAPDYAASFGTASEAPCDCYRCTGERPGDDGE